MSGVRPDGTTIEMTVAGASTGLLFLTGSCYGCQPLWEGAASWRGARAAAPTAPLPVPLVIVTPSPTTEDPRLVATLAPAWIPVVMSSDVWHAYRVARAPWYVGIANGTVVAHGLAPETWSELLAELARLRASGPAAS